MGRREFLRASVLAAAGIAAVSCAQPTAQVIEKQVPVEKVVKETVLVQKEVAVEKVVTATPVPTKYKEAPSLAGLVQAGKLPPVEERLPETPVVVEPFEEIGQYGGTWHRLAVSGGDGQIEKRISSANHFRWDKDGTNIWPATAEGFEASADNKTFTIRLRKGLKWSDGVIRTADDDIFVLNDVYGNEELFPTAPGYVRPGGKGYVAEKVDDYTWRITFEVTNSFFPIDLAGGNASSIDFHRRGPKHFAEQYHAKYTDKAKLEAMAKEAGLEFWYQLFMNKTSRESNGNPEAPVMYAWKIAIPAPKQPMVAERNPYFWMVDTEGNQLPYIDRIEWMLVNGAEQVNLRGMAGEIDMQFRHLTFVNYPLYMENREKGDYRILQWDRGYATDTVVWLNAHHKDPILNALYNDKRFRFALSLGIDRQEIIQAIFLGVTEPSQVSTRPESPFYWEEWAKFMTEYDVDKANAYLDEIGTISKRDAEGYRLRPDGARLSMQWLYATVFGSWADTGELLTAHWKKLGIELTTKEVDRQLRTQLVDADDYDVTPWSADAACNPLLTAGMNWHSGREGTRTKEAEWWDTGGAKGVEPTGDLVELYKLRDEFRASSNMEDWTRIFRQMLEINIKNLYYIGICTAPPEVVLVKNNFRNVPEQAISDYAYFSPANTNTEQYFIRQS